MEPATPVKGPSFDAVLRRLPQAVDVIDWIPFIDDPSHGCRRELWRLVATGQLDEALDLGYWRIVFALASGGPELAMHVLDDATSREDFLNPPPAVDAATYPRAWLRSAIALGCIGKAGAGHKDVADRFAMLTGGTAASLYTRVVGAHLAQRPCDNLFALGLTRDFAELSWKRVLTLLCVLGPCEWLQDRALFQIRSAILAHGADNANDHGLYVLAQLGPRAHRFLKPLDRVVAAKTANGRAHARAYQFALSHAMASAAAGRAEARQLLTDACLLSEHIMDPPNIPPAFQCAALGVGIMNDRFATQLADVFLTAPLLYPAFTAWVVLCGGGLHARAACDPLLAYLRQDEDDKARRRFTAVAIERLVDIDRLPALKAQLDRESDDCIKRVLANAIQYVSTLDAKLRTGIDTDEPIKLIFDDGTRC